MHCLPCSARVPGSAGRLGLTQATQLMGGLPDSAASGLAWEEAIESPRAQKARQHPGLGGRGSQPDLALD